MHIMVKKSAAGVAAIAALGLGGQPSPARRTPIRTPGRRHRIVRRAKHSRAMWPRR